MVGRVYKEEILNTCRKIHPPFSTKLESYTLNDLGRGVGQKYVVGNGKRSNQRSSFSGLEYIWENERYDVILLTRGCVFFLKVRCFLLSSFGGVVVK